jgi:hypothetical protein
MLPWSVLKVIFENFENGVFINTIFEKKNANVVFVLMLPP